MTTLTWPSTRAGNLWVIDEGQLLRFDVERPEEPAPALLRVSSTPGAPTIPDIVITSSAVGNARRTIRPIIDVLHRSDAPDRTKIERRHADRQKSTAKAHEG